MKAALPLVLCLTGCLAIGIVAYTVLTSKGAVQTRIPDIEKKAKNTSYLGNITSIAPPRVPPPTMKDYQNTKYRFDLFYPKDLAAKEYDEGAGAATILFQNLQTVYGFQIFVTPFAGTQITQSRFEQDEPSGVRNGLKNVTVDGATGASFYSTNATLGETAEIWFIHGGYLFEVTAPRSEAQWLSDILVTWKWI